MRRRRAVNLGSVKEVRSKKAALLKLAVILEPIDQVKCRPKTMMTFGGFLQKYRTLKLAFKWKDLVPETRNLWVVRAVNQGELHTPKYHRSNRPIRLTEADVARLLVLKERMKARDDDWMFPNRIKNAGKKMKTGPIWHETLLGRRIQPVADRLGLPHITWRLLRHWGATQMVEERVSIKAAQERLGHSRPDILLKIYAHVLDASADAAAESLSGQLNGGMRAVEAAQNAAL